MGYHRATEGIGQHCTTRSVLVTYVLNDVAMITNEEEGSTVRHINLHPNQACEVLEAPSLPLTWFKLTISVTWQVMQSDALTEVEVPLVEGLPVPAKC